MTLDKVRERLTKANKAEGVPSWYFSAAFDEARAAKAWGVDFDQWEALSDKAKGRMLAVYRDEQTMTAWEQYVTRPPRK